MLENFMRGCPLKKLTICLCNEVYIERSCIYLPLPNYVAKFSMIV